VRLVRTDDRQISGWDPYTVEAVAFESAGRTVALLVNTTARVCTLTLSGLGRGRSARVYQVTPAVPDMPEVGPALMQGGTATVTLPGRSITVVSAGSADAEGS
jgi:hypothetical protein